MAEPKVFVSMGTPYTPELAQFRDSLEAFLRDRCRVNPRIIGKNEYPDGNPLTKIRSVMAECHGVIVVAYERKFLEAGTEKRASSSPMPLAQKIYTTPWNHIESAMAFTLGLPLYILCQRELTEEGLIETKLDWYVQKIDVQPSDFGDPLIAQGLESWVTSRVLPFSKKPRLFSSIEGNLKLSEMTPKEILGVIGVIGAAFSAGVAAAHFIPGLFP